MCDVYYHLSFRGGHKVALLYPVAGCVQLSAVQVYCILYTVFT